MEQGRLMPLRRVALTLGGGGTMPSKSIADERRDALTPLISGHSCTRDCITGHLLQREHRPTTRCGVVSPPEGFQ